MTNVDVLTAPLKPAPGMSSTTREAKQEDRPAPPQPAPIVSQGTPAPVGKGKAPRFSPPLWLVAVIGALALVVAYVYVPRLYFVGTDDAYVEADVVSVVPKVSAYVVALHVTDNSAFKKGQLLVELDPRDFQTAVLSAQANMQAAQAAETDAQAQLSEQNLLIAADNATVQGDHATVAFAEQQLNRFALLAQNGSGTVENWQQAQSNIGEQRSGLQRDLATLAGADAQLIVLRSRVQQAKAEVARSQAALDQAKLNLSYTKLYAVRSGTVANRTVQVGDFVQAGQTLFSAVPDEVYIIANFDETQLDRLQVGQPVAIHVDAFPRLRLEGHIDSFQRGTGSTFALLPPENATGNFVKIVQRVPVKILLDSAASLTRMVGPGMSVEVSVTVRRPPSWLAWL
jgi:membrane fusion protein, multidrug efflux system